MCFNTAEEHYKSNPITDAVPTADAPSPSLPAAFLPRTVQPRARCQALPKTYCHQRILGFTKTGTEEEKTIRPKTYICLSCIVLGKGRERSALQMSKSVMFLPM